MYEEEIAKLTSGEWKFHQLELHMDAEAARQVRLKYISTQLKNSVAETWHQLTPADWQIDIKALQNKNIENLIGTISIPLGVAGPINLVSTPDASGSRPVQLRSHYVTMATTEGALIASTSRGCKVINASSGAIVNAIDLGITRAPVFKATSPTEARSQVEWCRANLDRLKDVAATTSGHLALKGFTEFYFDQYFWLRLEFATGEAMGMNMISKASSAIASVIIQEFPHTKLIALSGNLCSDKKATRVNVEQGRGILAEAKVTISAEDLDKHLHTTAESMVEVNKIKCWIGSNLAGGVGANNAHAANMIAAIWAATGQDLAHIVDSSACETDMRVIPGTEPVSGDAKGSDEGSSDQSGDAAGAIEADAVAGSDLEVTVRLPALVLGTVGGGTNLPAQKAARELMLSDINQQLPQTIQPSSNPVLGPNKLRLAEITAAAVLAGEISLHAALASGDLVKAHESLGKGRN